MTAVINQTYIYVRQCHHQFQLSYYNNIFFYNAHYLFIP
jgi:hypothetical protein